MSVTDLMANRYSERRFSPAPVEDEKLQAILAAGALAPTAENKQPQRILVVRGDEALAKMDKCTRCRFGAPIVLVLAYDMTVAARHPDVTDFGTVDIAIVGDHMSLAAEELGVESSLIVVRGVDTDVSPFDAGSYASSATYVTGLAAKNAATELREKICAKAAQMWDVDAADVVFDGQYVRLSDERAAREQNRYLTLRDFANLCVKNIAGGDALTSHASACLPVSPPPFMAGIAEVEVDKATGKVTVVDYAAAVDCGTVINEALARVQAEGGIAQGIGHALYEIVEHDDRGRLRTGNFMSYKLPTRLDIGSIRVAFEPSYEPTGPFGAKSIGEVVINTPLAAVASAVAHATGHQVRSLPITPEKALLGE